MWQKKLDLRKLEKTQQNLKNWTKQILAGNFLNGSELNQAQETIQSYYKHLISADLPYGLYGLNMSYNGNDYSVVARKYFFSYYNEHFGICDAPEEPTFYENWVKPTIDWCKSWIWSEEEIEYIDPVFIKDTPENIFFSNLQVVLAYEDLVLRSENNAPTYSDIAQYHYKVYEALGIPKEAWIGHLFEKHIGPGTWMKAGYYDNIPYTIEDSELANIPEYQTLVKAAEGFKAIGFNKLIKCVSSIDSWNSGELSYEEYDDALFHCSMNQNIGYHDSMFIGD